MPYPIKRLPNYGTYYSERKRGETSLVVLHHTAGHWNNDLAVLSGKKRRKVSIHWLVGRTEEQGIVAIIPQQYAAWHAGDSSWTTADGGDIRYVNDISLGIEMSRMPPEPYTPFQREATAQICANIIQRHPLITLSRIVGHNEVSPARKVDPTDFNWPQFRKRVQELVDLVRIRVGDEEVAEGRMIGGTTWVPVRVVAEAAGLQVQYKGGRPPTVTLVRP